MSVSPGGAYADVRLAVAQLVDIAARATRLQTTRLQDASRAEGDVDTIADGLLFVVAVRDTLRFAEAAAVIEPSLSPSVSAFCSAVPSITLIRNALEHADEFVQGRGRSQGAVGQLYVGVQRAPVRVLVGDALSVDVATAAAAVLALASHVRSALL